MALLTAVDKTGRSRIKELTFEDQGPATALEFSVAKTSFRENTKTFSLLSQSDYEENPVLDVFRNAALIKKYEEIGTTTSKSNVRVFADSIGSEVFFRENEAIIGFTQQSATDVAKVCLDYGLRIVWFDRRGRFGLFLLNSVPLGQLFERLQTDKRVLFAEPNVLVGADLPAISDLEGDGVNLPSRPLWNHLLLKRDKGGTVYDGAGVVIAVVDTPINLAHSGFSSSLYIKTHELYFGDTQPVPMAHGTSVSSILVDSTPIGGGVSTGIAPAAKLLPVSIDTSSSSSYAKRATAINFLASSFLARDVLTKSAGHLPLPRLIVNCSWQVRNNQDLTSVALAFERLVASGAICVCSAGNDSNNLPHFPSDYNGCLSIAGITRDVEKSKNSNYGKRVSFSMPGGDGTPYGEEDIFAAQSPEVFDYVSGTSFAAPHASGVLASIWSKNPNLTGNEVVELAKNKFRVSVDSKNPAYAGQLGAGLICFS